MNSNYSAASEDLKKAYSHLQGEEETSQKMREAIGILIDATIAMQFKRNGQVLAFPAKQREGTGSPRNTGPYSRH